jgi:hypothetical protein
MEPLIEKLLQDVYRRCVNDDDDIAIQEKYNTQDPKLVHYILYCLYYKVPETQLDQILQNVMLHLKEELQKPEYSDIKQLPIFSDHQLYYFDYFKLITTDNKEKTFLLIEDKEYLKLLQEQPVLPYILGHFGLELGYGTFFYILPNNLEEIQDFLEKYCTSEFSPGLREYATHNNPLMLQVIDDISNTLIGSDKEKIAEYCNILPKSVKLRHYVRYLNQNQELSVDEILAKIILAIQNHPNYDQKLPIFAQLEDFKNIIGKNIKNDDNLTSANKELPETDTTIASQNKPPQKGVTFGFNLESILKIFKFVIIGLATLGLAVGSYIGFFK